MGGEQGRHKRLAGARISMLGARLTSAGAHASGVSSERA
jgi:hypothetical protein